MRTESDHDRNDESDIWGRIQSAAKALPQVRILHFIQKLNDAIQLYRHLHDLYGLYGKPRFAAGIDTDLSEYRMFLRSDLPEEDYRQANIQFKKEWKKQTLERIAKYEYQILNQGLVLMCTILDAFLDSTYCSVISANEMALQVELSSYSQGGNKDLENCTRDEQIASLTKKFSWRGIDKKIAAFERCGLDGTKIFSFWGSSEEIQKKFHSWGQSRLEDLYSQRHDVVHRDELPIRQIDELVDIYDYFCQLVIYVGYESSCNMKTATDLGVLFASQSLYKQERKRDGEGA